MVAVRVVLEKGIEAHRRRGGAQQSQATEQQRTLQQHVNQANLLGLKGFRLDEESRDNAHCHPDVGGDSAFDALPRYDAHDIIIQKSNIPLRSVSAQPPHIPRKL